MITDALFYILGGFFRVTIGLIPSGILPDAVADADVAGWSSQMHDRLGPIAYWIPFTFVSSTILSVALLRMTLWGVKVGIWAFGAVTGGGTR